MEWAGDPQGSDRLSDLKTVRAFSRQASRLRIIEILGWSITMSIFGHRCGYDSRVIDDLSGELSNSG